MPHLRPPADTVPGRCRVRVRGLVQGVGFRPFVYALAREHGLTGWVLTDSDGVLAQIQGGNCAGFLDALTRNPPPLARIESVTREARPRVRDETGFGIRDCARQGRATTAITADAAVCP